MPLLNQNLGISNMELANIITFYSIVYMLGQFVSGFLNDRLGAKIVVGYGLIISITANIIIGFYPSVILFLICMVLNGAGQSTGWSGLLRIMSNWYEKKERGVVMGWWTTCYVIGGFLAVLYATWWGTNNIFPAFGWKKVFWAPALLLLLITILFWKYIQNHPNDNPNSPNRLAAAGEAGAKAIRTLDILLNPIVWMIGGIYFITKFIRYTFLFWLPLYFSQNLGYSNNIAGYTSSVFELAGFAGILTAGYLSDKKFHSGRFSVSSIFLLSLGILFLFQPFISGLGYWGNVALIGLAGFLIYGPDSLMSGAAAMDIGKGNQTGMTAGFINGIGSVGQLLSPYAVAYISQNYGWDSLFKVFLVMAFLGAGLLALNWHYGTIYYKVKSVLTV